MSDERFSSHPAPDAEKVDDDLRLVDEAPEIVVPASAADGTIFQPDAQYGLKLVPKSLDENDLYGLQTADETEAEIARKANSTQPGASEPKPPADESDLYGIAEPSPFPTPSPFSGAARPPKESRSASFRADPSDADAPTTSLEEIYERKRRERTAEGDAFFTDAKRPDLPTRPFWDRIFQPFLSFSFVVRIALISAAAFIPLFLATLFFARALSGEVEELLAARRETGVLIAFFQCIWNDKVVFLLFTFLWGVFSIPHSFHIFVETANGADEIDEWPEYNFVGGLGQFLWLATLSALGGIPGAALFSALRINPFVGFVLSGTILTPIFFLSCMQTDALFTLITKEIWRSFKRVAASWLTLYYIAFAFLFGTVGLALTALGFAVKTKGSAYGAALAAAVVSLAFSFIPTLYLRFLGRLAWVVDADARRLADEEAAARADSDAEIDTDDFDAQ